MKCITTLPALEQVSIPAAKQKPSNRFSQIKPKVSLGLRSSLRASGIGAFSTTFSALVSRESLGKDSSKWQALVKAQGTDFTSWTYFAQGCSVESLERWKRGRTLSPNVHKAACRAAQLITEKPFPVEEMSAIEPDFKANYGVTQLLIADTRAKLLLGTSSTIGLSAPLWKQSDHALGVPIHVDVADISVTPVFALAPFEEYAIIASYKEAQLPIGRIIFTAAAHSIIFDARPFLWTGEEVMVGKKRIRLVLPKGDIQRHLMGIIASRVQFDAIAS